MLQSTKPVRKSAVACGVARGLGGSHTDSREYSGSRQIPSESLVVVVRWFKVADDDGRRSSVARAARHGLEADEAAGRRRRQRKRAMHARAAETRDINIGGGEGGKGFTYLRVGAGHEPGRRRRRARRESRSSRAAAPPNIARSRDVRHRVKDGLARGSERAGRSLIQGRHRLASTRGAAFLRVFRVRRRRGERRGREQAEEGAVDHATPDTSATRRAS